jgi:chromate transport protein ChrA
VTKLPISSNDAATLLGAADDAFHRGVTVSDRWWLGSVLSIALGILVGAFLLAAIYLFPTATGLEAFLISVGYIVGIIVVTTVYNVFRRLTPIGWNDRYQRGLLITMGIFFVALALSFLTTERSALLWVPLAVAAVIPVSVYGSRKAAR